MPKRKIPAKTTGNRSILNNSISTYGKVQLRLLSEIPFGSNWLPSDESADGSKLIARTLSDCTNIGNTGHVFSTKKNPGKNLFDSDSETEIEEQPKGKSKRRTRKKNDHQNEKEKISKVKSKKTKKTSVKSCKNIPTKKTSPVPAQLKTNHDTGATQLGNCDSFSTIVKLTSSTVISQTSVNPPMNTTMQKVSPVVTKCRTNTDTYIDQPDNKNCESFSSMQMTPNTANSQIPSVDCQKNITTRKSPSVVVQYKTGIDSCTGDFHNKKCDTLTTANLSQSTLILQQTPHQEVDEKNIQSSDTVEETCMESIVSTVKSNFDSTIICNAANMEFSKLENVELTSSLKENTMIKRISKPVLAQSTPIRGNLLASNSNIPQTETLLFQTAKTNDHKGLIEFSDFIEASVKDTEKHHEKPKKNAGKRQPLKTGVKGKRKPKKAPVWKKDRGNSFCGKSKIAKSKNDSILHQIMTGGTIKTNYDFFDDSGDTYFVKITDNDCGVKLPGVNDVSKTTKITTPQKKIRKTTKIKKKTGAKTHEKYGLQNESNLKRKTDDEDFVAPATHCKNRKSRKRKDVVDSLTKKDRRCIDGKAGKKSDDEKFVAPKESCIGQKFGKREHISDKLIVNDSLHTERKSDDKNFVAPKSSLNKSDKSRNRKYARKKPTRKDIVRVEPTQKSDVENLAAPQASFTCRKLRRRKHVNYKELGNGTLRQSSSNDEPDSKDDATIDLKKFDCSSLSKSVSMFGSQISSETQPIETTDTNEHVDCITRTTDSETDALISLNNLCKGGVTLRKRKVINYTDMSKRLAPVSQVEDISATAKPNPSLYHTAMDDILSSKNSQFSPPSLQPSDLSKNSTATSAVECSPIPVNSMTTTNLAPDDEIMSPSFMSKKAGQVIQNQKTSTPFMLKSTTRLNSVRKSHRTRSPGSHLSTSIVLVDNKLVQDSRKKLLNNLKADQISRTNAKSSDSSFYSTVDSHSSPVRHSVKTLGIVDALTPNRGRSKDCHVLSPKDKVLFECDQVFPVSFEEALSGIKQDICKKLGEGLYGEVFRCSIDGRKQPIAVKLVPIEGSLIVNNERQKTFEEILPEIISSKELHALSEGESHTTTGFVSLFKVACVKGRYPDYLLNAWDEYDERKSSENDRPDKFSDAQLYILFQYEDGGIPVENFKFSTAKQAFSVVEQVCASLGAAEQALSFEHRDLHWGNILVSKTAVKQVCVKIDGVQNKIPTNGIKATIIDFTLSRLSKDGITVFQNLAADPELFAVESEDYQFEIYRMMQNAVKNNWAAFEPKNNVYWLHYLIDKFIKTVTFSHRRYPVHRSFMDKLIHLDNDILNYSSCTDALRSHSLFTAM